MQFHSPGPHTQGGRLSTPRLREYPPERPVDDMRLSMRPTREDIAKYAWSRPARRGLCACCKASVRSWGLREDIASCSRAPAELRSSPQTIQTFFKGLGICLKKCFKRLKHFKHFSQISNSLNIFKLFDNCFENCLNCLAATRTSCREAYKTYLLSYVLTCPPTCTCIHVCGV